MMRYTPAVFAVGSEYQILIPVDRPALLRVRVGDQYFYDETNGVMRSDDDMHRVCVPAEILDNAGAYTVCEREMLDRRPYFPDTGEEICRTFAFRKLPEHEFRAYIIADSHSDVIHPVEAAKAFGRIDLLILDGDIPDCSDDRTQLDVLFVLAENVTHGEIPCLFARGNHDLRGAFAERYSQMIPSKNGNSYYSFRIGPLWGVVLDCGEDKLDGNEEYGATCACHPFRIRQTSFLRGTVNDGEWKDDTIAYRLVLCHIPFTHPDTRPEAAPFYIEREIYDEWTALLGQCRPDLMISAHVHHTGLHEPDEACPFPVLLASAPKETFTGVGLIFTEEEIRTVYACSDGTTADGPVIPKRR